eukprot:GILJ01007439.1.p1 GENE.GILJ01007439.1~~GILJ01007439.1.p1  ORF type:complete len:266 (+),score=17.99 GILJ01007439.1:51-848(+)
MSLRRIKLSTLISSVALQGEAAHYLNTVLRLKTGDNVQGFDGQGTSRWYRIVELTKKPKPACLLEATEEPLFVPTPSAFILNVCLPLIKQDCLEWTVAKLAEAGADELQLYHPAYARGAALSENDIRRLRKITDEAERQSNRAYSMPIYLPSQRLYTLGLHSQLSECTIYFDRQDRRLNNLDVMLEFKQWVQHRVALAEKKPLRLNVLVGPEGGFNSEEQQTLRRLAQESDSKVYGPVSLVNNILKVETAALLGLLWTRLSLGES